MEAHEIAVMWDGEEYRISGGGYDDEFELSLPVAFNTLFARLHDRAIAAMPDHIRIHAASGLAPGGMFLLVGEKFAGKTTLATHLLLEGFDIVGDELVLLRRGIAVTFPRRFYLRYPAISLLPGLDDTRGAPFVNSEIQGRLLAIDPQSLGKKWCIREAPVQSVFFIEPNHGSVSSIVLSSKVDMVRRVLAQSTPPSSARKDWLADLCATINAASNFVIHLGDLASATVALRRIIEPDITAN